MPKAIASMVSHRTWPAATLAIVMDEALLALDLEANPVFAEGSGCPGARRPPRPIAPQSPPACAGLRHGCSCMPDGRRALSPLVDIGLPAADVTVAATRSGAQARRSWS